MIASRLEAAIELAVWAHRGQKDKADEPYILHPLRVMSRMNNDQYRIVAVLHDVVEDTVVTLRRIRFQWGNEVADAVDALTKRRGESYDDFIVRCGQNYIAATVKVADLEDNLFGRKPTTEDEDYVKARRQKYLRARAYLVERMP